MNSYYTLLRLRFGLGLEMRCDAGESAALYLIPPISLQLLLENAVKHNEFDAAHPLLMTLEISEDRVRFSNSKRLRASRRPSPGTGLDNLNDRYRLVTGREIVISGQGEEFVVEMPLLKTVI
jgi:LytS/YehU family sensor histidine kinase